MNSLIVSIIFLTALSSAHASKWEVKIKFVIGHSECKNINSRACIEGPRQLLMDEINHAQNLYNTSPRLVIKPIWTYVKKKDGYTIESLNFKTRAKMNRFMDKYFDHYSKKGDPTTGHMTVVVSKKIVVAGKSIGGNSNFPHSINPFNRKRGILMIPDSWDSRCARRTRGVFAHELGHTLGLRHTFERNTRCNKEYKKYKGGSLNSKGQINQMDYKLSYKTSGGYSCPRKIILNKCQKDLAAKIRKRYSKNGKVNYRKLRGLR